MSKTTISAFEFMSKSDTETAARLHFEGRRWRDGIVCPHCASSRKITPRKTRAMPGKNTSINTTHRIVLDNIEAGSQLYTDDARHWAGGIMGYGHASVNHSARRYVKGITHINGIESVWAVLKRGVYGAYHNISPKHTARYVNEFAYRLNESNVKVMPIDRINSLLDAMTDKRLTYKGLTA